SHGFPGYIPPSY
ncbi:unnamed protein product, partial [Caretta caretta]